MQNKRQDEQTDNLDASSGNAPENGSGSVKDDVLEESNLNDESSEPNNIPEVAQSSQVPSTNNVNL